MRRLFALLLLFAAYGHAAVVPPPNTDVRIALEAVVTGLVDPVALTNAGDTRLFVTLKGGVVVIVDGTNVLPTPFLDISKRVSTGGERGLLSIAFHPDYEENGFFYADYTNPKGNTVVSRFTVSSDPNVASASSEKILLQVQQPFANHNGGQLQFGPDGYLYIGLGDGGAVGDPGERAQSLKTLLGKILRIDVDGGNPYAIPESNPFAASTDARGEIWAVGFRNPWRFSFDRVTKEMFVGDVGQDRVEEIDLIKPSDGGHNYGWRRMEGSLCFNPSSGCNDGTMELPIIEYNHTVGCSVAGGYRYRGTRYPQLAGIYFFGDLCSGRIWSASPDWQGKWTATSRMDTSLDIVSFGEDSAGEIYVVDFNGDIYRIADLHARQRAMRR